jgi:hypothetical protein
MTSRWVNNHPGWLVDDNHVLVLVKDRERQGFGLRRRLDRGGDLDVDDLSAPDWLVRLGLATSHADQPFSYQLLNSRS